MSDTIDVHLTLTRDKPNSMNFEDTHSGVEDVWYKFEADAKRDARSPTLTALNTSQDTF